MGNVNVLATMLVATATMPHRLTAWKMQKRTELRVYQGVEEISTKYPYVFVLHPDRNCTGSLITPEWVLTAAHCCRSEISHIQYDKLSILFNGSDTKSEVIKSVLHPQHISLHETNDLALLLVSPEVRLDKYGVISAVDYSTLLGLSVEYVGSGRTFMPKRITRNKPLKRVLDILRPLLIGQGVVIPCKPSYKGRICVAPKCSVKQMNLPVDSGGPLLVDNIIVGVTSGGPAENLYGTSDRFFTPISPHQEWIHRVVTSKLN